MYINKQDTTSKRASILAGLLKIRGGAVRTLTIAIGSCTLVLIAIFGFVSKQPKPKPAPTLAIGVQWLGSPVVAQEKVTGHLTNVEFGIREDGVVIWRDKRGPSVDGKRFGQFEMPPAPFKGPDGKILP